jgi:hypothetical protein
MPIRLPLRSAFTIVFAIIAVFVNAQTSVLPRLVAYAHTTYDGANYTPTDSGTLTYSNSRVYNSKTATFQFDSNHIYVYQLPSSSYGYRIRQIETYDGANNLLTDLTQRLRLSDSSWVDSLEFVYTYDALGTNLMTKTRMNWDVSSNSWLNIDRYVYYYDAANNITAIVYQIWGAINGWQNNMQHVYTYDSHNNQLTDLFQLFDVTNSIWINNANAQFTYNTLNKQTSTHGTSWVSSASSWKDSFQNYYTYDTLTGNRATETHHSYLFNVYTSDTNYVYSYDSHNNLISLEQQLYYVWPTLWNNSVLYTYTYDASGNRLTSLRQLWKEVSYNVYNYVDTDSITYTYNSYNQLTSYLSTTWNYAGFWEPAITDHFHHYYYELPSNVSNIKSLDATINLYPSPANDRLNVEVKTDRDEKAVMMIIDISGRLWMQWQTDLGKLHQCNVPVSQLPAGDYILSVKNESGQVSKMFTVAH